MKENYISGVCNIGPQEIRKRQDMGFVGLCTFLVFLVLFIILEASPLTRLIAFVPIFFASINFLQVRNKFCAYFGWRGVFDMSVDKSNLDKVQELELIRIDKLKAISIILQAVLISTIITALTLITL